MKQELTLLTNQYLELSGIKCEHGLHRIPFDSGNRIIIIQFRCLTIYSLLIYD